MNQVSPSHLLGKPTDGIGRVQPMSTKYVVAIVSGALLTALGIIFHASLGAESTFLNTPGLFYYRMGYGFPGGVHKAVFMTLGGWLVGIG